MNISFGENLKLSIKLFFYEKRGWTTWTTAAVDKRVFAALPIVMVMLFK
jgi:PhoPQ-activated pathogenicity-related protein